MIIQITVGIQWECNLWKYIGNVPGTKTGNTMGIREECLLRLSWECPGNIEIFYRTKKR